MKNSTQKRIKEAYCKTIIMNFDIGDSMPNYESPI